LPVPPAEIDLQPVSLAPLEIDKYYAGFSNEILWPLFHDMAGRCNFDPEYWKFYQAVNGMNLVPKEFCAASLERNSVLILAESAGAADQLQDGALMVNPNDQIATAEAIYRAFKMPFAERSERMDRLRHIIRETDVYWWVNSFLKASFAENIDYFLKVEDYRPQIDLD
jgi:trehalose-6-phosphate synthase